MPHETKLTMAHPIIHMGDRGELDDKYLAYWTTHNFPGSTSMKDLIGNYHAYPRGAGKGLKSKRGEHVFIMRITIDGKQHRLTFNLAAGGYLDNWAVSFDGGGSFSNQINRIDNSYWRGMQANLQWTESPDTNSPRQAGASFSRDSGTYAATARHAQGSPIIAQHKGPHHQSAIDLHYDLQAAPLEFDPDGSDPDGSSPSTDHNGNLFEPVIYPDMLLGWEVIPNFNGVAGHSDFIIKFRNKAFFPDRAVGLTNVNFRPSRLFLQDKFTAFYIWSETAGLGFTNSGRVLQASSPFITYLDNDILYSMDLTEVVHDVDGTPQTFTETDLVVNEGAGLILDDPGMLTIGIYCSQFTTLQWRLNTGSSGKDGTAASEIWTQKVLPSVLSEGWTYIDTYLVIRDTPANVAATMAALAAASL